MTPELSQTTNEEKSPGARLRPYDDPALELVEWHDLQNAQVISLMDFWDNPEDECWNNPDISGYPTPTPL